MSTTTTRFEAKNMLEKASKFGVTTFCAPPTIYRFLIKEDLTKYNFGTSEICGCCRRTPES